jgi:hypothetical protein
MVLISLILNVGFAVQLRCGTVLTRHIFVILATKFIVLFRPHNVKERVLVLWGLKWKIILLTVMSLRLAATFVEV